MSGKSSVFVLLGLGFLISSLALQCSSNTPSKNSPNNGEESIRSGSLIDLEFAENFKVKVDGNDTIIEVTDGKKSWTTNVTLGEKSDALNLPLKSVSCLSTSHLYYFIETNSLDNVLAVSFVDNLQDPKVKNRFQSGSLKSLTTGGSSDYDVEILLELQPELFTTYPFGDEEFDRLQRAGIPTLHFTEYLEKHPLGRVEWIKLVGFLMGKEKEANTYFNQVKQSYLKTKQKASAIEGMRPSVINANGHANKWSAPNGNSLVAHFIKDAGGKYVFDNDTTSGNLTLDFERVYEIANSADYWASIVFDKEVTLATFTGDETRLNETKVIKEQRIFYCNAQSKDYFGKGILEPHLILEDVFQILHPDSSEYVPHYFESFKE